MQPHRPIYIHTHARALTHTYRHIIQTQPHKYTHTQAHYTNATTNTRMRAHRYMIQTQSQTHAHTHFSILLFHRMLNCGFRTFFYIFYFYSKQLERYEMLLFGPNSLPENLFTHVKYLKAFFFFHLCVEVLPHSFRFIHRV